MRAYLRFRGIDFEDIEVNALTKAELKSVVPGYKKVPVVIVKDQTDNTEAGIDKIKNENRFDNMISLTSYEHYIF